MLVWLDLETTGLDEVEDRIMEMGMVVTSDDLTQTYEPGFVYIFPWSSTYEHMLKDRDFVRDMHTKSGLIDAMKTRQNNSSDGYVSALEECEADARAWLAGYDLLPVQQELCGATIHFDRTFLRWHMPHFEKWFHYRNFDVSTLKRAAQLWSPSLYKNLEDRKLGLTNGEYDAHRAVADCYAEIMEARIIQDAFKVWNHLLPAGQKHVADL